MSDRRRHTGSAVTRRDESSLAESDREESPNERWFWRRLTLLVIVGSITYYGSFWFGRPWLWGFTLALGADVLLSAALAFRRWRRDAFARRAAALERDLWRGTLPPRDSRDPG